jgi:hypothetical protein
MGSKLRSRLPEGNGLTAELAEQLADDPGQVVVVGLLDVDQVVRHVHKEGSRTTVFEFIALEAFDGDDADQVRALLTKRHEDRTGETGLWPVDGYISGSSTGDPAEVTRQLDLLRREEAAKLREQAEATDDKATADQLESDADAFESGSRDEELRARIPQALFSDGEGDAA